MSDVASVQETVRPVGGRSLSLQELAFWIVLAILAALRLVAERR
jgi:hypothetical protein